MQICIYFLSTSNTVTTNLKLCKNGPILILKKLLQDKTIIFFKVLQKITIQLLKTLRKVCFLILLQQRKFLTQIFITVKNPKHFDISFWKRKPQPSHKYSLLFLKEKIRKIRWFRTFIFIKYKSLSEYKHVWCKSICLKIQILTNFWHLFMYLRKNLYIYISLNVFSYAQKPNSAPIK